ncbi:MAG: hypothetical protein KDN20_15850 [Verrucomicrobiae bacterium]|nr:hypothetical protein [Verrucomicrobiae bacterium]
MKNWLTILSSFLLGVSSVIVFQLLSPSESEPEPVTETIREARESFDVAGSEKRPPRVLTYANPEQSQTPGRETEMDTDLSSITAGLADVKEEDYRQVATLRLAVQEAFRLSPEKARAWVMSLPRKGVFLTAYRELGRLEASDPESAVAQMERMEDGPGLEYFYSGLISGLSMEDPAYAMDLLVLNRETFPSIGSLESIVIQSTLTGNPRLALLAIRQKLPREEHPRFFYQTYSHWAAMNVQEALTDLEGRGDSQALSVGAVGLFERWARMDRPAFERWLSANPESRFIRQANTARAKVAPETQETITDNRIEMPVFDSVPKN